MLYVLLFVWDRVGFPDRMCVEENDKRAMMENKRKWWWQMGMLPVLLFFLIGSGWAQQSPSQQGKAQEKKPVVLPETPGILKEIGFSADVDTLLMYQALYRSSNPDKGYRILIFSQSGNYSKNAAMEALENFQLLYPDEKVYLVFEEPYFKVKVGNFTSRIEASLYLKSIKADYPYAFVIKDVLDMEEYLNEENLE